PPGRRMVVKCLQPATCATTVTPLLDTGQAARMTPLGKPLRSAPSAPALRIRTLGCYRVELNGSALPGEGRSHGRPLQLLALLIAMGAREVPIVRLQEALWPDADGDRAHRSFATTLHR